MASFFTVSTARALVRQFAKSAGDGAIYAPADIDRAILAVGCDFLDDTKFLKQTDELSVLDTEAEVNLSSLDGFRPELLLDCFINEDADAAATNSPNLKVVEWSELRRLRKANDSSGLPTRLAFTEDFATAEVYPTPDQDYSLALRWTPPFTSWTAGIQGAYSSGVTYYPEDLVASGGTVYISILKSLAQAVGSATYWTSQGAGTVADPTATFINIPDDVFRIPLMHGAPSLLQHKDPDYAYATPSWQKYEQYKAKYMGRGNLGPKIVYRRVAT